MKKLKVYLVSETGNAIILVLIISLCCSIIISITIYTTFNQFQYSQLYKESSNMDYLAISGAEKAINDINNTIQVNFSSIVNNSISELLSDIANATSYNKILEYNYNNFKIKDEILKSKVENKIFEILAEKIKSSYKFSYELELGNYKYKIDVEIKGNKKNYSITSKVTNISTGNICKAAGNIYLENVLNFDSTLFEQYLWKSKNKPELLSNVLITNGNISLNDNAFLTLVGANIIANNDNYDNIFIEKDILIANDILINQLDEIEYLINKLDGNINQNNIIVIKEGEQTDIDIQSFYDDVQPQASIIIDIRPNKKIRLVATDKNIFNGIIYSNGQIEFASNMIINGIVISNNKYYTDAGVEEPQDNILVAEGVSVNIVYDENSILNLRTDNYMLKRYIYDFFKITNYKNASLVENQNDISDMLGYLKIKDTSSINTIIDNIDKTKFKFTTLKITDI